MFLQKLEVQGFKSFAEKTTFLFPGYQNDRYSITAIIGPNGSGKSNVADAVRWVLGEQSLKLLRSKRAEDVIFFGSSQKAQKGFCEVSLYFNNEDHTFPVDYSEVVITRRLFRDGASEYLLNKNKVRLSDIALSLAQAHIGQRSYSVIGQGMVDTILQTAPTERKEFFNEAVGVRPYQMKRDTAALKLKSTNENLVRAATVLSELEPRMRFFARQLKRLEEREEVERAYYDVQKRYTNVLWNDLEERRGGFENERDDLSKKVANLAEKQRNFEQEFLQQERAVRTDEQSPFQALNRQIADFQQERQQILTRLSVLDSRLHTELVTAGKGQVAWLSQRRDQLESESKSINEDLHQLRKEYEALLANMRELESRVVEQQAQLSGQFPTFSSLSDALEEILMAYEGVDPTVPVQTLKEILESIGRRLKRLKKMLDDFLWRSDRSDEQPGILIPSPDKKLQSLRTRHEILLARITLREEEQNKTQKELEGTARELHYLSLSDLSDQHTQALKEKEALTIQRAHIEEKITEVQRALDALYENEKEAHRTLLELQKEMSTLGKAQDQVRDELTRVRLEIAKLDAHQEELRTKIFEELRVPDSTRAEIMSGTETVYSALGFVHEVTPLDREETRFEIERLKRKLEQIGTIDSDVLAEHEEAKQRYEFLSSQVADLTEAKTSLEHAIAELDTIIHEQFEKNLQGISKKFEEYFVKLFGGGTARLLVLRNESKKKSPSDKEEDDDQEDGEANDAIAGIEIEATPPGKKFKSLSFLSGGEKALTAIALLCAILAQNPSPFVILDEVDAALDESNAYRFASIINDLSNQTQFILVTHNRVTMHIGKVLYGVTMGAGGVSSVLSLDIRQLDGIVRD